MSDKAGADGGGMSALTTVEVQGGDPLVALVILPVCP